MKRYWLLLIASLLASNLASTQILPSQLFGSQDKREMHRWADSIYNSLSTRERLAQLIMPIVYPSDQEGRIAVEERRVQQNLWGGILYQRGVLAEQAKMNARLQQTSRIPMLIALDGEWGLYMRLKDAPRYPRNMGLGIYGDKQLLYNYGREIARQCRAMGIHINFAPTVDVNINPRNPVIGTRSFGDDPKRVAEMSLAYAQGLEDGNVLSVAKHFPGHGDSSEDSHKTLPLISASKERMERVELYPFAQYIREGFGGIMTAHLRVPAYEPRPIPSSLSHHITTELLQRKMKFSGLIFTDGLEMKGVLGSGMGDVGVAALMAGNDILLGPRQPEEQLKNLLKAYEAGELSEAMIRHKVMKVLYYKWRLIISPQDSPFPASEIARHINTPSAIASASRAWEASLIYYKRNKEVETRAHQGVYKRIAVLDIGKNAIPTLSRPKQGFGNSSMTYLSWDKVSNNPQQLNGYDLIVVNAFSPRAVPQSLLLSLGKKCPILLVYYTTIYRVPQASWHQQMSHVVLTSENTREAQEAVLTLIAPREPRIAPPATTRQNASSDEDPTAQMTPQPANTGNNTPPLPSLPQGWHRDKLTEIDRIVEEGIKDGAFPGSQVYILHKGQKVYHKAFGLMRPNAQDEPVTTSTLYDVASITKALALTPAVMLLVGDGKLALDTPISRYLPSLKSAPIGRTSVRQLLLHQSGLPGGLNFYTDLIDPSSYDAPLIRTQTFKGGVPFARGYWANANFAWLPDYISPQASSRHTLPFAQGLYISPGFRQAMIKRIANARLTRVGQYRYSDLGFVLLQEIVEQVSHQPLDQFLERRIFSKINAKVYFRPLDAQIPIRQIAPSQDDRFLRKQIIRGTVDDETAASLGGVGGNAGLFACAEEIGKIAQLLLNEGMWDGKQIIPRQVVKQFISTTGISGRRALGFDKPTPKNKTNHAAQSASALTIGHLGFTGGAFWIDPKHEMIFIFLSNRTYPSRLNRKLLDGNYRARLHQAAYEAMLP